MTRPPAPGRPEAARSAPDRARRGLLVGSPQRVLARLVQGDPLDLRALVASALERRALSLDPDASYLAALARVAHASPGFDGEQPLQDWLDRQVGAALDDRLREEAQAVGEGDALEAAPSVLRDLARPLDLAPEDLRAASVALNHRPLEERRAFVRVVLDHEDAERAAEAEGVSLVALARRARAALEALISAVEERRG